MRRKWKSEAFIGLLFSISVLSAAFPHEKRSVPGIPSSDGQAFKEFEEKLETLRRQLKIPGMAAGVI